MDDIATQSTTLATDGQPVNMYVLRNLCGSQLTVLDWGATWYSARITLQDGSQRETLLGGRTLSDHLRQQAYMGATVGRYGNRIAHGHLQRGKQQWQLSTNQHGHTLHGGVAGFSQRRWHKLQQQADSITLELQSAAGDQGFPGTLLATVTYQLTAMNEVIITYRAQTDEATPVNLTNHAYFNLSANEPTLMNHSFKLAAAHYLPVDQEGIPCAPLTAVADTPYDLNVLKPWHHRLGNPAFAAQNGGLDHSYAVTDHHRPVATLISPDQRLTLQVTTSQPALHVYTGNFLHGEPARNGGNYANYAGLALEAQQFPDAPNQPQLPGNHGWLLPGEVYHQQTTFSFIG